MKKIVTIGGATQDVYLQINAVDNLKLTRNLDESHFFLFESGEKVEVERISYFTGGGASNSAVAFKRLGLDIKCFCLVGYDVAGRQVIDDLAKEGIPTSLILKSNNAPTGTSYIISSSHSEQTIFAHRGANNQLPLQDFPAQELDGVDYLYITSLGYNSSQGLESLLSLAKTKNISVAMNPGLSQITKTTETLKKCLSNVDIFILNASEAKTFMVSLIKTDEKFRTTLKSKDTQTVCPADVSLSEPCLLQYPIVSEHFFFSIHEFFKEILAMGPRIVVITNGTNGVYVATRNSILFHPSLPTQIVNTVGAGDAFGSTFVASLALGTDIENALRNGVINSASVIGKVGAKTGLLTHNELEEVRKRLDANLLQKFPWQ